MARLALYCGDDLPGGLYGMNTTLPLQNSRKESARLQRSAVDNLAPGLLPRGKCFLKQDVALNSGTTWHRYHNQVGLPVACEPWPLQSKGGTKQCVLN